MRWRRALLDVIFTGGELTVRLILILFAITAFCVLVHGITGGEAE